MRIHAPPDIDRLLLAVGGSACSKTATLLPCRTFRLVISETTSAGCSGGLRQASISE